MTTTPAPAVMLDNATLGYVNTPVLTGITLDIKPGELVGLVGCSGAGKSTLLAALTGAPVLISGTVRVGGNDPSGASHPVGLVPQLGDDVLTQLSIDEVVALGSPRRGLFTSRAERTQARELLSRLGLSGYHHRRLGELSGGQRQRVAIARALTASTTLLLCDEPTSGADPALTAEIVSVLADVAATGTAVLIATHDLASVVPHLDRVIGIADGTVGFDGNPEAFGATEQAQIYGLLRGATA